jgi:hypothetical protein
MATPEPGEVEHFVLDDLAVFTFELHGQLALAGEAEVGGAVLVAKGVTADHDGLVQPGTRRGTFWQMIGSRKITPPENVADGAVGRAVHALEAELFDAGFIRGDGGAFHADAIS